MHLSYIVRVYRHEKNNPRMLVGTVEKIGEKRKTAFTNMDELWEIMNSGEWAETRRERGKKIDAEPSR